MKPYTDLLYERLHAEPFLIVAHRGFAQANIIENTVASMQAGFLAGADVVEVDVICAIDDGFYAFHDGEELRLLAHQTQSIRTLNTQQIQSLRYFNQLSKPVNAKVQPLAELLQALPDEKLLNLDRGWFYLPKLLPYLDKFHLFERILLKTPATTKNLQEVGSYDKKYMYFAICRSSEEVERALLAQQYGVNLVGLELVADTPKHAFLQTDWISRLQEKGYIIFVNTLNLDAETVLWGDYDDDRSVTLGPEYGWGQVIAQGVDMINTDWPSLLANYRQTLKPDGKEKEQVSL